MKMRSLILLAATLVVACSSSHGMLNETDGGSDSEVPVDLDMVRDFGVDFGTDAGHCVATDTPPPSEGCLQVSNHWCGDAVYPPECVAGEWQCPDWIVNDGTTCWCSGAAPWGGCICTEMGLECPSFDGGVDAAIDSGPFLDIGVGVDAGPAPFVCGDMICDSSTQYCTHVLSDEGGVPDSFYCSNYTDIECSAHNCSCFGTSPTGGSCDQDSNGYLTFTIGGG